MNLRNALKVKQKKSKLYNKTHTYVNSVNLPCVKKMDHVSFLVDCSSVKPYFLYHLSLREKITSETKIVPDCSNCF